MPACRLHGRAVITNTRRTTPTGSAGRPEVMFIMERMIGPGRAPVWFDRLGCDGVNLAPSTAMPYKNPLGLVSTAVTIRPRSIAPSAATRALALA